MNVIREIQRINKRELDLGLVNTSASWHSQYQNAAWVYIGNLPHELTEGDILCVFSQWGEVEDIHLVRDADTGKSKGFAFLKYYDARSCTLAVDNFCGMVLLNRTIRVDHVQQYRLPKHLQDKTTEEKNEEGEMKRTMTEPGHAYHGQELANAYTIHQGPDLFLPSHPIQTRPEEGEEYKYTELPFSSSTKDDSCGAFEIQVRREDKKKKKKKKEEKTKSSKDKKKDKKHDRTRETR